MPLSNGGNVLLGCTAAHIVEEREIKIGVVRLDVIAEEHRNTKRAEDLWSAIVEGETQLEAREEGSTTYYRLVERPVEERPKYKLTLLERDVVALAAKGELSKLVAYTLGISTATVSSALGSAAMKIGVTSRAQLLRVAGLLTQDRRAANTPLTTAEEEIVALVQQGLSNVEIARARGRSVRTVANQVASLLRKTGGMSRRALITG